MSKPNLQTLLLSDIQLDPTCQARAATNDEVVADYAEKIGAGVKFPPAIVFFDGSHYWLADGFHRHDAATEAGEDFLLCDVREGGRRDAQLYAAGANSDHGLYRSSADKRRAVGLLLNDAEWRRWSDRRIADHCGVSNKLVATVRRQLGESPSCDEPEKRVGKDGKARTVPAPKPSDDELLEEILGPEDDDEEDEFDPDRFEEESPDVDWVEEWARDYRRAINDLVRMKKDFVALAEDEKLGGHLHDKVTRITRDIDSLRGTVRQMEPVQLCGGCEGSGCQKCASTGFWTRAIVQRIGK